MAIKQVIKHLHELHVLHLELIRLGEQKKVAIIANQVDELSKLVQSETKLAKTIGMIEGQWRHAAESFMSENNFRLSEQLTVSGLAKLVFDESERTELLNAQTQLVETLNKLKQLNEQNQQLLTNALAYVNYSLDLITDAPDDYTYQKPATTQTPSARKGIFDTKA